MENNFTFTIKDIPSMYSSANDSSIYHQNNFYSTTTTIVGGMTELEAQKGLLLLLKDMIDKSSNIEIIRKLYMYYLEYLEEKGILEDILKE